MSDEKACDSHHHHHHHRLRLIIFTIIAILALIALVIFIIWAVLKPSKPTFTLQDITVTTFNLAATTTASNTLTTTLQVTITSKNPNNRIGVYYERVDVYASYRNQQITLATSLPSTYQGHNDVNVWSPFLYGNEVPVAPFVATALSEDLNTGRVLLNVRIDGRVKWKVGTWMSSEYHLHGNCPAYITVSGGGGGGCDRGGGECSLGIPLGGSVKYQSGQGCIVDVAL